MYWPITPRWNNTINAHAQCRQVALLGLLNGFADEYFSFAVEKLFS